MKIFLSLILLILLNCSASSTSKYSNKVNKNKSQVNVTLSGDLSSGACYGCN